MDHIHPVGLETPALGDTVEWYRDHFDCGIPVEFIDAASVSPPDGSAYACAADGGAQ